MSIEIGQGSYFKSEPTLKGPADLIVGNYTSISSGFKIDARGGSHNKNAVTTYSNFRFTGKQNQFPRPEPVQIGSDCWIGFDVTIMPGVKIGNGAIIGAGSFVRRDVTPWTVAYGNPCQVRRQRFSRYSETEQIEIIQGLERIQWWNWSEEKIRENMRKLLDQDILGFVREFRNY